MGKVKTRLLGLEDVEEKQKKEQKEKAAQKKAVKKKAEEIEEPKKTSPTKPLPVEKVAFKIKKVKKEKPRGKKYQEAKKLIDKTKAYLLKDAVALLKKIKTSKMDESVELHLVVDETGLKGEIELPYSTGKIIKVEIGRAHV